MCFSGIREVWHSPLSRVIFDLQITDVTLVNFLVTVDIILFLIISSFLI